MAKTMTARKKLRIADVRLDGGTQARAELNSTVVAEYAELLREGEELPPIIVFFDGSSYWLADGFHRFHAHGKAGYETIVAIVNRGTVRSAVLWAVGCNDDHGLRRSNEDKRRAVEMLLADEEWRTWSQEKISAHAKVSKSLVSKIVHEFASLHGGEMRPAVRTVERAGKTFTQNTAKIGKARAPAQPSAPERRDPPVGGPGSTPENAALAPSPLQSAEPEFDPEFEALAELEAANQELTRLRRILEADDKTAEVLRWRDAHEVLQRRCNEHLGTIEARDVQIAFLTRQLKRCGKALGEVDTDKIAPAVEHFVREVRAGA